MAWDCGISGNDGEDVDKTSDMIEDVRGQQMKQLLTDACEPGTDCPLKQKPVSESKLKVRRYIIMVQNTFRPSSRRSFTIKETIT